MFLLVLSSSRGFLVSVVEGFLQSPVIRIASITQRIPTLQTTTTTTTTPATASHTRGRTTTTTSPVTRCRVRDRITTTTTSTITTTTRLFQMKRPFLDRVASALFRLEGERVERSSELDDRGRYGEPMEWSESNSFANRFGRAIAENPVGYRFKQFVADVVAGEYDEVDVRNRIQTFVDDNDVAMFSFTTCPFCRRAKDALDEGGYAYGVVELDELVEDNLGNAMRAELGRRTRRTSVPSIFVRGTHIGGCNDGPGLLPLMERGEFSRMLES